MTLRFHPLNLSAAALLFFSGAAALGHQLLWVRLMVDALGAAAGTFAVVTGAFFLGLSLGALLASRWTPRQPFRGIVVAELAIALIAIAGLGICQSHWLHQLPQSLVAPARFLLPFLIIGTSSAAMGVVIPWIIAALGCNGRTSVALYAANTLGGLLGIAGVVALALPAWGLSSAILALAMGNVFVAVGAGLLGWRHRPRSEAQTTEPMVSTTPLERPIAIAAFGSGFLIIGQEVVIQHQISQIAVNTLYSSAFLLGLVIFALFLSALGVAADRKTRLTTVLRVAALLCFIQPLLFFSRSDGLRPIAWTLAPGAYFAQLLVTGLIAVVPVFLAGGMLFPTLLRTARGAQVGTLLAWNGLGGWLGAEAANHLIAPFFGLWQSMALFGCGYLLLLTLFSSRGVLLTGVPAVCAIWFTAALPQAGIGKNTRLQDLAVGREGVVAVTRREPDDQRMLFNNTYSLGGSKAQLHQERQAHLPLLLHGSPRRVATLGVATGSTVAGVALHPTVEQIEAIELSPVAGRFARKHFGEFNRNVFDDPRVTLTIDDARWRMIRATEAYDVIIGDLFLPWRTGEARLFTREHFESTRKALREDGLFCQWLPLYQLTREQYESILSTFRTVFPEPFIIRGDFFPDQPIIGLVGGRKLDDLSWPAIAAACERLRRGAAVKDPTVLHPEGVAMMIPGTPPPPTGATDGVVNTLANAWLEWNAGRNAVGLATPWFTSSDYLAYLRQTSQQSEDRFPAQYRAAHRSGIGAGEAGEAEKVIEALIPASLQAIPEVEWSQWPGRVIPFRP